MKPSFPPRPWFESEVWSTLSQKWNNHQQEEFMFTKHVFCARHFAKFSTRSLLSSSQEGSTLPFPLLQEPALAIPQEILNLGSLTPEPAPLATSLGA